MGLRSWLAILVLLAAASGCCGDNEIQPLQRTKAAVQDRRPAAAVAAPLVHNAPAHKRHVKLRRDCPPDDARCIALREHTCDPYFTNVSDVCTFVQYNKHCAQDVHHIAYLPLFYCRQGDWRVLVALSFLAWMGVLFWVMSKAAEDFLVPALEYLAKLMRMAPDVAGVTLFAFASGAPDLFTQIAAVAGGASVDQELAISATLGGGLFIIAVIFSLVVLVNRPPPGAAADSGGATELTDRRAFLRDSLAYLLSTLGLLGIMLRGVFSAWEAGLLLLGYGTYLAVCVATSKGLAGAGGMHGGGRHGYAAMPPPQQEQQQAELQLAAARNPVGMQQAGECGGGGDSGTVEQLNGVVVAGEEACPTMVEVELAPWPGGGSSAYRKKPADGSSGMVLAAGGKSHMQQQQQRQQSSDGVGSEVDSELSVLVAGQPLSDAHAAGSPSASTPLGRISPRGLCGGLSPKLVSDSHSSSSSTQLGKLVTSTSLGLQEMLHTKGKSGPVLWLTMMMSPAVLLLHATMPALHTGSYTPWYALILSLGAPLFSLLSTGLYPQHLSTDYFILTWLLSALALLALVLLAVQPASPSAAMYPGGSSGGLQHAPLSNAAAVSVVAVAGGSPTAPPPPSNGSPLAVAASAPHSIAGGSRWARSRACLTGCSGSRIRHLCGARRPRRNGVLALLASVQCMLWLSVAADELVSLFQAIGRICDISQDLLGATVLAWGEAVPELVATMSLARQGQATTAVAAVLGGPCFNIGLAWAGPTLVSSLRKGAQPYQLSAGVGVLVCSTLLVLAFFLLAIPRLFRWRLARGAAVSILLIYTASQISFLLAEEL